VGYKKGKKPTSLRGGICNGDGPPKSKKHFFQKVPIEFFYTGRKNFRPNFLSRIGYKKIRFPKQ